MALPFLRRPPRDLECAPRRVPGSDLRPGVLALVLIACGATSRPTERDDPSGAEPSLAEAAPDEPSASAPAAEAGVRTLGASAQYADLLRAARALDDRRDQDSDAGCLLRRDPTGWRLEADLAVAVRPLADAPDDLDARLAVATSVVVLSRWGRYGGTGVDAGGGQAVVLNTVTSTVPALREPAIVWLVTDAGVYVRSTAGPSDAGPRSIEAAAEALGSASGALFIAAESAVPVSRLAEVLAAVPPEMAGRVALAVTLAEGVRLPGASGREAAGVDPSRCDALPELPAGVPVGDLPASRIVAGLGSLRRGAARCVGASAGLGVAGARVTLSMRIGPDGVVAEACVVESSVSDAALHECLVRAARSLAFEAPSPPGVVDVRLPLSLSPTQAQRQRALCD